nr:PREDICTED: uncharacterized protein LOC103561828 [Equus przewalskii]
MCKLGASSLSTRSGVASGEAPTSTCPWDQARGHPSLHPVYLCLLPSLPRLFSPPFSLSIFSSSRLRPGSCSPCFSSLPTPSFLGQASLRRAGSLRGESAQRELRGGRAGLPRIAPPSGGRPPKGAAPGAGGPGGTGLARERVQARAGGVGGEGRPAPAAGQRSLGRARGATEKLWKYAGIETPLAHMTPPREKQPRVTGHRGQQKLGRWLGAAAAGTQCLGGLLCKERSRDATFLKFHKASSCTQVPGAGDKQN